MNQSLNKEELITRYLLGLLNEQEQAQVEQQYFADKEFYELLLAVEDELIDSYVAERLTTQERESFEKNYLRSPERRERLEFAGLWKQVTAQNRPAAKPNTPKRQPSTWKTALSALFRKPALLIPVAASAILIVAGVWLIAENSRLKRQVLQLQAEQKSYERENRDLQEQVAAQEQVNEQLAKELEESNQKNVPTDSTIVQPTAPAVSFVLLPGLTRDPGQMKSLVIPKNVQTVKLLPRFRQGNYESYTAVLQTVDGKPVWHSSALKSVEKGTSTSLTLRLPARLLASGDYILNISGSRPAGESEDVAEYTFRIKKE